MDNIDINASLIVKNIMAGGWWESSTFECPVSLSPWYC